MAWTAKDFVAELGDVEKLLSFNAAQTLQDSLVTALLKKTSCSQGLMASDFVTMLEAVEKSSLDDEKKQWLKDKLMEKAASSQEGQSGTKIVKSPQSLTNVPAYLTKDELQQLMTGEISKAPHIVVARLRMIGLTSLEEDTKRSCVALLVQSMLWHGMQMPDGDYTYMLTTQFTRLFQTSQVKSNVAPCKTYPDSPKDMGDEWIRKVYGDDAPCLKTLPQLPSLAGEVCIRNTNMKLTQNAKKSDSSQMSSYDLNQPEGFLSALKDIVNKSSNASSSSSSTQPAKDITLTIFDVKPSPKKALADGTTAVEAM